MDSIINALAKAQDKAWPRARPTRPLSPATAVQQEERVLSLSPQTLKAHRVVSFDGSEKATRPFDVLRNMCTHDLAPRMSDRPVFGVLSPTHGCGSSTTAANFAFSLARAQGGKVVLADFSTPGEGWWKLLGLDAQDGQANLANKEILTLEAGGISIYAARLLPVVIGKAGNEIKQALHDWIDQTRRHLGPVSIVLDLPPLLSDDRVATLVSEIDLVLLILATGKSTMSEVETCKTYLHEAVSVQLVLNKAGKFDL